MVSKPRPALVVFWVSVAVLVGAVLYLGITRWQAAEDANIESIGTRPAYTPSVSASPTPTPTYVTPSPSASASPVGPTVVAAPTRVSIPAIDVNTKVFPVALTPDGALEIPEDIRYVGWYKLGVPPGVDRGSAVLVAHRDGRVQGRGVFYNLGNLKPGNKVYVETSAGETLPYKVVSRELILKKSLPYEELFAVDGAHRLTLISCGGYYDRNNGGYQDNVVVTAVPMFTPITTNPADPNAEPSYAATPTPTPTKKGAKGSASPSASKSEKPTPKATESKAQTFSNKPSKKATPTPTPAASTPEPSAAPASSAASEQPVSVAVPGAGTIAETSTPVLLGGGKS